MSSIIDQSSGQKNRGVNLRLKMFVFYRQQLISIKLYIFGTNKVQMSTKWKTGKSFQQFLASLIDFAEVRYYTVSPTYELPVISLRHTSSSNNYFSPRTIRVDFYTYILLT